MTDQQLRQSLQGMRLEIDRLDGLDERSRKRIDRTIGRNIHRRSLEDASVKDALAIYNGHE